MNSKKHEAVVDRIERTQILYEEGKTQSEIAQALGVHKRTVSRYMIVIYGREISFDGAERVSKCEVCKGKPTPRDEGLLTFSDGKHKCSECLCPGLEWTEEDALRLQCKLQHSPTATELSLPQYQPG